MTVTLQKTITEEEFTEYTRLAQGLGYADLHTFLASEMDKALFALTIPPDAQIGGPATIEDVEQINLLE